MFCKNSTLLNGRHIMETLFQRGVQLRALWTVSLGWIEQSIPDSTSLADPDSIRVSGTTDGMPARINLFIKQSL
jgi:hypothetical protein